MNLVLASTSRYRAELLRRLERPFSQAAPEFDERAHDALFGTIPHGEFALRLARGKAESLLRDHPSVLILAADQIGVLELDGGALQLHKPGTEEAAVEQLMRLSGRTHELVTGVVLLDARTGWSRAHVDRHRLTMRSFESDEAGRYVESHRPLDCAGGYRIEDAGIGLFERIEGEDHTGIVGLPLMAVARMLREADAELGRSG